MKRLKFLVVTTLILTFGIETGHAHRTNLSDEMAAYIKRDGLMHLMNSQRYILQEMLVGKKPVDQDEFVRAAKSLAAMLSMIPSTFAENLIMDTSLSKPEIWQNWQDFVAKASELEKIANEMVTLAETEGAEAALENVRLLNCGNCHRLYRN